MGLNLLWLSEKNAKQISQEWFSSFGQPGKKWASDPAIEDLGKENGCRWAPLKTTQIYDFENGLTLIPSDWAIHERSGRKWPMEDQEENWK